MRVKGPLQRHLQERPLRLEPDHQRQNFKEGRLEPERVSSTRAGWEIRGLTCFFMSHPAESLGGPALLKDCQTSVS